MGWGWEDQERQDEIDAVCAALKTELSASKAREAELQEKLNETETRGAIKALEEVRIELEKRGLLGEANFVLRKILDLRANQDKEAVK